MLDDILINRALRMLEDRSEFYHNLAIEYSNTDTRKRSEMAMKQSRAYFSAAQILGAAILKDEKALDALDLYHSE